MPENVNKVWEGEERSSSWNKGIICRLCREQMGCTNFIGVTLCVLLLTKPCPESYITDIESMSKLSLKNSSVG